MAWKAACEPHEMQADITQVNHADLTCLAGLDLSLPTAGDWEAVQPQGRRAVWPTACSATQLSSRSQANHQAERDSSYTDLAAGAELPLHLSQL